MSKQNPIQVLFVNSLAIALTGCGAATTFIEDYASDVLGLYDTSDAEDDGEGGISTPFEGDPKDAITQTFEDAVYCLPNEAGEYPKELRVTHGGEGDTWAEGGGCIHRPIRTVWRVMFNHRLMVWSKVNPDDCDFKEITERPDGISHLFRITYRKPTPIGKVKWDIEWFHRVAEGSLREPLRVNIRYQKTTGIRDIRKWRGNIILNQVTPEITEFKMRNELNAKAENGIGDSKSDVSAGAVNDVYNKLSTGEPNFETL